MGVFTAILQDSDHIPFWGILFWLLSSYSAENAWFAHVLVRCVNAWRAILDGASGGIVYGVVSPADYIDDISSQPFRSNGDGSRCRFARRGGNVLKRTALGIYLAFRGIATGR